MSDLTSMRPENRVRLWGRFLIFGLLSLLLTSPARSQDKFGGLGLPTVGEPVEFTAEFLLEKDGRSGKLAVTATLGDGYHIYSTTQPPGGPFATEIRIKDDFAKVIGEFEPDREPEIHTDEPAYGPLELEEFYDQVVWTANIEINKDIDPKKVELNLTIDALVCREACRPFDAKLKAKFAGFIGQESGQSDSLTEDSLTEELDESDEAPPMAALEPKKDSAPRVETSAGSETLRVGKSHAVWNATLTPSAVKPGDTAILQIKAINDPGYHVYPFVGDDETNFRTLMIASQKSGLAIGKPTTSAKLKDAGLDGVMYHEGEVVWNIPVQVAPDADKGSKSFELQVGFSTCNDSNCDFPEGFKVQGILEISDKPDSSAKSLLLASMKYNDLVGSELLATSFDNSIKLPSTQNSVAGMDASPDLAPDSSAEETGVSPAAEAKKASFGYTLLLGLLAGFILNFMPCVLPVLGLKVMSFMNQAGNSHSRVVGLNLAYVAGILAVMLALAGLTLGAKQVWGEAFGWGEQFTYLQFKVFLACLMFAMALSFLGVWEIPIPGFATSNKSGELMEKEGFSGAFIKGVLTTVLATPCSGPMLGPVLGLSLSLTALEVLALYLTIGLGLALPFIVLCFYPNFIKMLPKPGNWMETLKQILAFPLLLTTVYFIASIEDDYRIATLILVIFVWFACWWIGRVAAYESTDKKLKAWTSGLVAMALGGVVGFGFFGPFNSEIEWVPYEETQLERFRAEGKTVMLDFTAKWCLNCQYNTRYAIDRQDVAELVHENDVVPMLADWTSRSQEIRDKLDELQSNSIPLLVIYPPGPNSEPILLPDVLTESRVLEALEEAGPSGAGPRLTSLKK